VSGPKATRNYDLDCGVPRRAPGSGRNHAACIPALSDFARLATLSPAPGPCRWRSCTPVPSEGLQAGGSSRCQRAAPHETACGAPPDACPTSAETRHHRPRLCRPRGCRCDRAFQRKTGARHVQPQGLATRPRCQPMGPVMCPASRELGRLMRTQAHDRLGMTTPPRPLGG